MQRVARGDSRAFAVLVDRYAAVVRHWAWQITQHEADADDICQEAYIRLWRSAARFDPDQARLATWLRTITRNLALNQLRRRRGQELDDTDLNHLADPSADLESQIQRSQQNDWLVESIARLPPRQQEAMRLVYGQGLSNRQAAEQMQLGLKALEALLVRAKRHLRQAILAHPPTPSERVTHA